MNWTFFANATEDDNTHIQELQTLMEMRNRWNNSLGVKSFSLSEMLGAIDRNPKVANTLVAQSGHIQGNSFADKVKTLNESIENIRSGLAKKLVGSLTTNEAMFIQTTINSLHAKLMQAYGVRQNSLPVLLQRMLANLQHASRVISESMARQCPVAIDLSSSSYDLVAKFYILVGIRNEIAHATEQERGVWRTNDARDSIEAVPIARLVRPSEDPELIACKGKMDTFANEIDDIEKELATLPATSLRARRSLETDLIEAQTQFESAKREYDEKMAKYILVQHEDLRCARIERKNALDALNSAKYSAKQIKEDLESLTESSKELHENSKQYQAISKKVKSEAQCLEKQLAEIKAKSAEIEAKLASKLEELAGVEEDVAFAKMMREKKDQEIKRESKNLCLTNAELEVALVKYVEANQALIRKQAEFDSLTAM